MNKRPHSTPTRLRRSRRTCLGRRRCYRQTCSRQTCSRMGTRRRRENAALLPGLVVDTEDAEKDHALAGGAHEKRARSGFGNLLGQRRGINGPTEERFGAGPDSKPLGTYRTATSTKLTSVYTPVCTMYERTPCAALAALEEPTLPPRRSRVPRVDIYCVMVLRSIPVRLGS